LNVKRHALAFAKAGHACSLDCRRMHVHILAATSGEMKPKPFLLKNLTAPTIDFS
jgi:hypothetical protein